MIPFSRRNLILFVVLSLFGTRIQAQQLHFSDLQSLYPADSAAFGNFCRTNGFGKERFHDYDSSYFISWNADTAKRSLGRSFPKYPSADPRKSFILTYSIGEDEQQFDAFKKEIEKDGFAFKQHRTTSLPGNYSVDGDNYEKGSYTVSLQTQTKAGKSTVYSIAFFMHS